MRALSGDSAVAAIDSWTLSGSIPTEVCCPCLHHTWQIGDFFVSATPRNALVYVPSVNVFVLTGDVRLFEETFENVANSVRRGVVVDYAASLTMLSLVSPDLCIRICIELSSPEPDLHTVESSIPHVPIAYPTCTPKM